MNSGASKGSQRSRAAPTPSSPCSLARYRRAPALKPSEAAIGPRSSRLSTVPPPAAREPCRRTVCKNSNRLPLIQVKLSRRRHRNLTSPIPATGRTSMLRCILAALATLVLVTVSLIPDDAEARGGRGGGGRGRGGYHGGGGL